MKVLLLGDGGREAAMAWALSKNPDARLFCTAGNAGLATYGKCTDIPAGDIEKLHTFAKDTEIDLTVVGPEATLVKGIVDRFRTDGLAICGPTAAAAHAEGSKEFFKQLLTRHDLPTATPYEVCHDPDSAYTSIRRLGGAQKIVIKADGLMGGKGVKLPENDGEVRSVLKHLMVPGTAGVPVVIERRLTGRECSVMAVTDGEHIRMLAFTQDYKRRHVGDIGPNTGGMGAHTLDPSREERQVLEDLLQQVVSAFADAGFRYTGFIYLGVMLTDEGPMILECNVRLGDPEAQVILPASSGDFLSLCYGAATGTLSEVPEFLHTRQTLCVTLTSKDYPDSTTDDNVIMGLDRAREAGALVFHAGTSFVDGKYQTNKAGRALHCVGVGDTLAEAHRIAYAAAEAIEFPGKMFRSDIGSDYL